MTVLKRVHSRLYSLLLPNIFMQNFAIFLRFCYNTIFMLSTGFSDFLCDLWGVTGHPTFFCGSSSQLATAGTRGDLNVNKSLPSLLWGRCVCWLSLLRSGNCAKRWGVRWQVTVLRLCPFPNFPAVFTKELLRGWLCRVLSAECWLVMVITHMWTDWLHYWYITSN